MKPEAVAAFEKKIAKAIEQIFAKKFAKKLPIAPTQSTVHLMSKAAVTVYESVVANTPRPRPAEPNRTGPSKRKRKD